MLVDLLDLIIEIVELRPPGSLVLLRKHVSGEALELADLVLDFVGLGVNLLGTAGNSFEVGSEDGEELLNDDAGFAQVVEDALHVDGGSKDLFGFLEVPALDRLLAFDVAPGLVEFLLPLLKHRLALLDDLYGVLGLLLENLGDVNLSLHLVADFIADALQNVLHLALVLVDVSRNRPDQLQARQQRGQGLLDHLQVAPSNVLELAVQRRQELNKVLCLSVELLELSINHLVVVEAIAVGFEGVGLHNRDDLAHLGHVELLVEGVEGGGSLAPVLSLALG